MAILNREKVKQKHYKGINKLLPQVLETKHHNDTQT